MKVTKVRHEWPAPAGFCLNRVNGRVDDYTFVHFISEVSMVLDGVECDIPAHACIVWRPGTPQFFRCREDLVHDWFHVVDVSDEFFEQAGIPLDTLFYPRRWGFVTELVGEMENEFFAEREGGEALIELKARELIIKLSRTIKSDGNDMGDSALYEDFVSFRRELLQSPAHPWSVAEMAERTSFSQSRFFYLYRSFFGTSPVDDLIRARIDFAKSMLSFTSEPVCEISESLGYANVTHFCRQFKKLVGMTPTQYKKSKAE